jgi:hypothetical protein
MIWGPQYVEQRMSFYGKDGMFMALLSPYPGASMGGNRPRHTSCPQQEGRDGDAS